MRAVCGHPDATSGCMMHHSAYDIRRLHMDATSHLWWITNAHKEFLLACIGVFFHMVSSLSPIQGLSGKPMDRSKNKKKLIIKQAMIIIFNKICLFWYICNLIFFVADLKWVYAVCLFCLHVHKACQKLVQNDINNTNLFKIVIFLLKIALNSLKI